MYTSAHTYSQTMCVGRKRPVRRSFYWVYFCNNRIQEVSPVWFRKWTEELSFMAGEVWQRFQWQSLHRIWCKCGIGLRQSQASLGELPDHFLNITLIKYLHGYLLLIKAYVSFTKINIILVNCPVVTKILDMKVALPSLPDGRHMHLP